MINQEIIDFIKKNGEIQTPELAATFKVSRQSAAKWMKKLVEEGIVIKLGSTRSARYLLATPRKAPISGRKLTKKFEASYTLSKLNEDDVFRELDLKLGLQNNLSGQAYKIIAYAFTEMLNNAIDHSRSKKAQVRFKLDKNTATFSVRDFGVGIYRNLKKSFALASEFEAVSHLLKGKQTTAPSHHS
ncbi:MAG: winged helix-turn-helix transcriptional regulator, partial [Proteobacteria bacterium]|nr:winged helix-turn-helix transcriptional regulator [Pseudomonadota bacterium]